MKKKQVQTYLNDQQFDQLQEKADLVGLSIASYVRSLILKDLKNESKSMSKVQKEKVG